MITDSIANAHQYDVYHPYFHTVFEILQSLNFAQLENGHIELDGKYVFINIDTIKGRTDKESPLESHKRYIDIQIPLSGGETFGVRHINTCHQSSMPYSEERDVAFWHDTPNEYIEVKAGDMIIFFPDDAHAPCITTSQNHKKMVVKVSVELNNERPTL